MRDTMRLLGLILLWPLACLLDALPDKSDDRRRG
jgi:hypothetical protein